MDTFFEGIFWIGFFVTGFGFGLLICHSIGRLWLWGKEKLTEWLHGMGFLAQ